MSNRWAILIGINGYHESLGPLSFCVQDALRMRDTLTSDCCGFSPENILLLTDEQSTDRVPTFGNIHSWLGAWLSRPGPDDLVLVYFAGHGRETKGRALLAPQDATLETLPVTGIPIRHVCDLLDSCPAARKVLILDACHSGAGRDVAAMTAGFRDAIEAGTGLYTIALCDGDQISYEWPEKQCGVFTHYLVDAIRHSALPDPDGRVNLDRVYESTRANLLAWTSGKRLTQDPVRICRTKGDIHIAVRPLSLEQQLAVARMQISEHQELIKQLSDQLQKVTDENATLSQEKKQLADKIARRNTIRTKRVVVQEWKEWLGGRGPDDWEDSPQRQGFRAALRLWAFLIGLISGFITGVILYAACRSPLVAWTCGPVAGLLCGIGVWLLAWLPLRQKWKNMYRLYCLRRCIDGSDTLGATAYAFSMGRLGIDLGTGAATVCTAAELAATNGDIDEAKALYRCAITRWKSPHAKRALVQLLRLESEQP